MQTVTVRIPFSAGHRLYKHEGQCGNIHGHNYVAHITAKKSDGFLDTVGRVIDFAVLKGRYKKWIDENWDHGFLWYERDPVCQWMFRGNTEDRQGAHETIQEMKNYPCSFNPTAENMADWLLAIASSLLKDSGVIVTEVRIEETENCSSVSSL